MSVNDSAAEGFWRRLPFRSEVRSGSGRARPRPKAEAWDSIAPSKKAAAETLRLEVERLAKSGALDEGSAAAFDVAIVSWVEQWHNDIDDAHDALIHDLRLQEAQLKAEFARMQEFERLEKVRLAAIDHEITDIKERVTRRRGWWFFRGRRPAGGEEQW